VQLSSRDPDIRMKNHNRNTPASGQQLPWSVYMRKEKNVSEPISPQLGGKKTTIATDFEPKIAIKRDLGDIDELQGPKQKKQKSVLSTLSVSKTNTLRVQNKSKTFHNSPVEKNQSASLVKSLKFLKDLDGDFIMRLVQQFYDPTRSLVQASGNQYLSPVLRPLEDTDLKFSGQKFSKHCRYVAMRTLDKKGTITEAVKLREGGTNNDHPRYIG
jgi:hypothetical protein